MRDSPVLSSFAFLIQQKLFKPRHRLLSMYIGVTLMLIAVLGLTWNIGYTTLLIFIVIESIASPFFITPMASATFNVINEYHEESLRAEYIINKEIVLNLGRIISTLVLIILLALVKQVHVLNFYLLFLGSV